MGIARNMKAIDRNVDRILEQLKEMVVNAGGYVDVDDNDETGGDRMYSYVYWNDTLRERRVRAIWLDDDDNLSFYAPEYLMSDVSEEDAREASEVWTLGVCDELYELPTIVSIAEVIEQYL